jgi:hypothetical protein
MHDAYKNTVNGLLKKRAALLGDLQRFEQSVAAASNAIECIDRVLNAFDYAGPLADMRPTGTRHFLADRHGVSRFIMDEMRNGQSGFTSRQMAIKIIVLDNLDPLDQKLMHRMVGRVGKVLRTLRRDGHIQGKADKVGTVHWYATGRPDVA